MMRRGYLVYASTIAEAERQCLVCRRVDPRGLIALFSPANLDLESVDFRRARETVDVRADLAACAVAFPRVDWAVWGRPPRPASLALPTPSDGCGDGAVDVLSLLGRFPSFVQYRGARQRDFLAAHGIGHGWTHARDLAELSAEIDARRPRVVLNEVWTISPATTARLARMFPGVQFVALTHGVPGWIATERPVEHYDFLRLARESENCHYGHVMPVNRCVGTPGTKIVSLPNIATLPGELPSREDGPPTVSLIARDTESKQWGSAVAAVALAARSVPDLHVIVSSSDLMGGVVPHLRYLDEMGVPYAVAAWGSWTDYLDRIARSVDVHLTATIAESFCLIPLEHCMLGRPVAGTAAVEWLPAAWCRNHQDPAALARVVVSHFRHYDVASQRAMSVGTMVADENHRNLLTSLRSLIDR